MVDLSRERFPISHSFAFPPSKLGYLIGSSLTTWYFMENADHLNCWQ